MIVRIYICISLVRPNPGKIFSRWGPKRERLTVDWLVNKDAAALARGVIAGPAFNICSGAYSSTWTIFREAKCADIWLEACGPSPDDDILDRKTGGRVWGGRTGGRDT